MDVVFYVYVFYLFYFTAEVPRGSFLVRTWRVAFGLGHAFTPLGSNGRARARPTAARARGRDRSYAMSSPSPGPPGSASARSSARSCAATASPAAGSGSMSSSRRRDGHATVTRLSRDSHAALRGGEATSSRVTLSLPTRPRGSALSRATVTKYSATRSYLEDQRELASLVERALQRAAVRERERDARRREVGCELACRERTRHT